MTIRKHLVILMAIVPALLGIKGISRFHTQVSEPVSLERVASRESIRFTAAGFGDFLLACDSSAIADRDQCESLHEKLSDDLRAVTVSRSDDARRFVSSYLGGRFEQLLTCLKTTCDGLFVVNDGPAWADRWTVMLGYQACIHAAPAVWLPDRFFGHGYSASARLSAAAMGTVTDCPFSLSQDDFRILDRFNLAGAF